LSARQTRTVSAAPLNSRPQDASSIAGLLLTTEAVVTEKPEPKGAPSMPGGGGGMGDMY
jgi:hypothetical protein